MGLVYGRYDAKEEGFLPGGSSLHNSMVPHGPDADAYTKGTGGPQVPYKLEGSLAFMFESRWLFRPTRLAMESGTLDRNYAHCWDGLGPAET